MAHERLRVVLSVRRRAVEEARRVLVQQLKSEAEAEAAVDALDDETRRNRQAGRATEEMLLFLDMIGRRVLAINAARQRAMAALIAAQARSAQARQVVASARASEEAVETLLTQREAADVASKTRRDQHILDDLVRARSVNATLSE